MKKWGEIPFFYLTTESIALILTTTTTTTSMRWKMDRQTFINKFAKIELTEFGEYGHYPFQGFAQKGEHTEMMALALGGDVMEVYNVIRSRLDDGYDLIHLILDFPKMGKMYKDFMFIMTFKGSDMEASAIPYDTETGETFAEITGDVLEHIKKQTMKFVYGV